ncbi:MAG: hypothetical protein Q6373_009790 [Candidatus Sigynarchaeota archaeon]
MNLNRINLGTSILLGCSFASGVVSSYYLGQILSHIETNDIYALVGFCVLYPLVALILANLNEPVKKIMIFASATLAIVGSYVLMLGSPNTVPVLKLDTIPLYTYFMALGGHMCLFIMGSAEVLRRAREMDYLWLGLGMAIGCAAVGIVVWTSIFGWLYMIMIINYIVPVAILVYFLFYPEGKEGETNMRRPQTKEVVRQYVVADTWKGGKITFYTLITAFSALATAGVGGMAMPQEDYFTSAPWFWSFAAAGAAGAAVLAKFMLGKIIGMPAGVKKEFTSNVAWLVLGCAQGASVILLVVVEFYVPGYHLSFASGLVGGAILGFNIVAYMAVLSVQHPPRSNYAFYMFNTYFILFGLALASYLRSINVDISEFYALATEEDYILYIIGALAIVLAMLVVNQVITIAKTAKAARDVPEAAPKAA